MALPTLSPESESRKLVTVERLKELLNYDPGTGLFTWLATSKRGGHAKAGAVAGCLSHGYPVIRIDGQLYGAHRLAILYMTGKWPANEVDHRNMDRADNRWANLREVTRSENMRNRRRRPDNATGFKGVQRNGRNFQAVIEINGKRICRGTFTTAAAAHEAYGNAALELHGEFARLK